MFRASGIPVSAVKGRTSLHSRGRVEGVIGMWGGLPGLASNQRDNGFTGCWLDQGVHPHVFLSYQDFMSDRRDSLYLVLCNSRV